MFCSFFMFRLIMSTMGLIKLYKYLRHFSFWDMYGGQSELIFAPVYDCSVQTSTY